MIRAFLIALAMLCGISACHASSSCPTLPEARRAHPTEYLSWHGEHCWSAHRTAGDASRLRRTRSLEKAFSISKAVPAARVVSTEPAIDADWSMVVDWWFDSEAIRPDMRDAMLLKAAKYRLRAQFDIR